MPDWELNKMKFEMSLKPRKALKIAPYKPAQWQVDKYNEHMKNMPKRFKPKVTIEL